MTNARCGKSWSWGNVVVLLGGEGLVSQSSGSDLYLAGSFPLDVRVVRLNTKPKCALESWSGEAIGQFRLEPISKVLPAVAEATAEDKIVDISLRLLLCWRAIQLFATSLFHPSQVVLPLVTGLLV